MGDPENKAPATHSTSGEFENNAVTADGRSSQTGSATRSRGFLSSLVILPTSATARDFGRWQKWAVTGIVSLGTLAGPLSSGILYPVLSGISDDLNTSATVVNLSVALSSLAVAICPLWWSHAAESYGRRVVYILSFTLFGVFNILSAVSVNIGMLIAMRLLASGACSCLQTVSAGTISDLWHSEERGKAMGMFFLGPMLGPLLAPIIGGGLAIRWDWRSTQWFLVMYGFIILLLIVFCLPETSLSLEQRQISGQGSPPVNEPNQPPSAARKLLDIIVLPVKSIKLLRFFPILLTVYYTSITFAVYYLLNISIQKTFSSPPYSWSPLLVGLTYTPSALGYLLGAVLGGRWTDHIMKREARRVGRLDAEGEPLLRPEDRIRENAWVAGIMCPCALLWWGWTVEKHVFWIVPLLANFFFGFGCMLITNVTMTMLTEFTPKRSSTAVAVTNLVRNSLACIAAVIADPLINAIGDGWTFTSACIICLISGLSLILMRKYRERWSEKMRVALATMEG